MADEEDDPRLPGGRNVWRIGLVALVLVVLSLAQWIKVQASQDVWRALAPVAGPAPVDYEWTGMRFAADGVLIATFTVTGVPHVTQARWRARPWGEVELVTRDDPATATAPASAPLER